MRAIVNIRGCNGAGKSTIALQMLESDPKMEIVYLGVTSKGKPTYPAFTIFPTYNWIALGTYLNKTGGLDTMSTNEDTYSTLLYVLKNYPNHNVLFEGVISSTIYSTWSRWLTHIQALYSQDKVMIFNFIPPLEVCLARIQLRNGGKPIKTELVESKWNTVLKNAGLFKRDGLTSLKIDTSKYQLESMLDMFFRLVKKYTEE